MKINNMAMPHYFSLYLDIVRFAAALAVFLNHISSYPFTKDYFWSPLSAFGGIAVIIFFVLSGYVIAYVTSNREKTLSLYASARIARIYSVVIIALLITLLFDNVGLFLNPEFYSIQKVMWKPQSLEGYLSSLLFLNEYHIFNFHGISPGSNAPYWSLSFEVTYYVVAGLFIFTRMVVALPLILIIFLIAGKTIAALFPIWLLGYLIYFIRFKKDNSIFLYSVFFLSIVLIVLTPYLVSFLPSNNFGFEFLWGRGDFNRNLIKDYFPAVLFAINILCAREISKGFNFRSNKQFEISVRWLGSLTFPLYLIHFPALALFSSISPWSRNSTEHVIFISVLTFLLVFLITPVSDKFKYMIREKLMGILPGKSYLKSANN